MNKRGNKRLLGLATTFAVFCLVGTHQLAAHAAGGYTILKTRYHSKTPYHVSTFRSVFMYNPTHTAKIHNLKNYPKTTWYVSKSLLIHWRTTGKNYRYFYVTNGKGTISGLVWHGFLARGVNPNATAANSDTNSTTNQQDATTNSLSQTLIGYFDGTVPNAQLQTIANKFQQYATIEDPSKPWNAAQDFEDMLTKDYPALWKSTPKIKFLYEKQAQGNLAKLKAGSLSFKDYVNNAITGAEGNENFHAFKGDQIGAYACPKSSRAYGQGVVIIQPATASHQNNSDTNANDESNSSNPTNSGTDNPDAYSGTIGNQALSRFDHQVDDLFSTTMHSTKLDQFISLWYSSGENIAANDKQFIPKIESETGLSHIKVIDLNGKVAKPYDLQAVKAAIKAQGVDPSQYNGYQIGSIVFPAGIISGAGYPGDGMIILGQAADTSTN